MVNSQDKGGENIRIKRQQLQDAKNPTLDYLHFYCNKTALFACRCSFTHRHTACTHLCPLTARSFASCRAAIARSSAQCVAASSSLAALRMCANECAHEVASLASSPAEAEAEADGEAEAEAEAPLPAGFSSFLAFAADDDDEEAEAALAAATAAAPPSAASVHHSVSTSLAPHGLRAASASSDATPAARVCRAKGERGWGQHSKAR
jgi:hypothetical protein